MTLLTELSSSAPPDPLRPAFVRLRRGKKGRGRRDSSVPALLLEAIEQLRSQRSRDGVWRTGAGYYVGVDAGNVAGGLQGPAGAGPTDLPLSSDLLDAQRYGRRQGKAYAIADAGQKHAADFQLAHRAGPYAHIVNVRRRCYGVSAARILADVGRG